MRIQALAAMALSASQAAALSSQDIVNSINQLTDLSSQTNDIAKSFEISNLADTLPKVTDNFKTIVQKSFAGIQAFSDGGSPPQFQQGEQSNICQAFSNFVKVHQNLLMTISGKDSVLSTNEQTVPLAAILRVLEGSVDNYANNFIGEVPTCQDQAKGDLKSLDGTLDDTSSKLNQILPGGSASLATGLQGIYDDLGSFRS